MKEALVPRSDFLGLEETTHLYTAAECPMLARAAAAFADYAREKSRAEAGRARHAAVALACKEALAQLLGVEAESIALVASASDAINQVCGAIEFRAGDNVVRLLPPLIISESELAEALARIERGCARLAAPHAKAAKEAAG